MRTIVAVPGQSQDFSRWLDASSLAGIVPDVGLCSRHDQLEPGWFSVVAPDLRTVVSLGADPSGTPGRLAGGHAVRL